MNATAHNFRVCLFILSLGGNLFADIVLRRLPNASSTELESGHATDTILQTQAPVLDVSPGPMGAGVLSSTWLGFGNSQGTRSSSQYQR